MMNGYILITKACNMNCEYCYYNIGLIKKEHAVMTDSTLVNSIEYLKNNGATSVQFTGGECFTAVERLKKGIGIARDRDLRVYVATNLKTVVSHPDIINKAWFREIDCVIVSIHIDRNTDEFYYNSLMNCVKLIKGNGVNIRLIFTISAINYIYTSKIIDDCYKIGVELMLQLVSTRGANSEIESCYSIKNLDKNGVACIIDDLKKWAKNDKDGITYINQLIRYLNNLDMELCNCSAGKSFMVFEPNGDVHPCFTREDICFGNVNTFVDNTKIEEFCRQDKFCADLFCVCKSIKY